MASTITNHVRPGAGAKIANSRDTAMPRVADDRRRPWSPARWPTARAPTPRHHRDHDADEDVDGWPVASWVSRGYRLMNTPSTDHAVTMPIAANQKSVRIPLGTVGAVIRKRPPGAFDVRFRTAASGLRASLR